MGNCVHSDNGNYEPMTGNSRPISTRNRRPSGLTMRFEAVEGTLFLYRSIIQRNWLQVKKEAKQQIEEKHSTLASFATKKQKLYEIMLKKIDMQTEALKETIQATNISKDKKQCLELLSDTYALIQDIGELIKLEDVLQADEGALKSKQGFDELFEKYGVSRDGMQDSKAKMDSLFGNIAMAESTCIKKREVHNFLSSNQLPMPMPIPCEASS